MSITVHKNKIGLLSIIAISVSGIIGSGWLFSAYIGAKSAGSAVYVSWFITLFFFILMALAVSEIVSLFPIRGIVGRMGAMSHNKFFGAIFSFAIWLELVGSLPGEAQASVQYLSNISPSLSHSLMENGSLTFLGLFVTLLFLVFFWAVNLFGVKLFAKINNTIAVFKIFIPVFTALLIMAYAFDSTNFKAYHHEFMPYGVNSIMLAITASGMIYAFNGFQLASAFASEIKNPKINLPLGMVLSIIICFAIYLLLQTAFIGALEHTPLATYGWHHLNYNSPFLQLTMFLGLNFMAVVLYADACLSPTGTGITFVGGASRILYSMAAEKQMPGWLAKLHPVYNYARRAMIFNFFVALIFLALFHSWAALILFITALIVLMYMVIPISLIAFRKTLKKEREFQLPFAFPICALLFVIQSVFFIFIGFENMSYLTIAITVFMILSA